MALDLLFFGLFFSFITPGLCSWSRASGYIQISNLSTTSWDAAVKSTVEAKTLYNCALLCKEYYQEVGQDCTAFHFDGSVCNLAHVTFLEEAQDGVTTQVIK